MVKYFAMDEKAKCRPNSLPVLACVASPSNRVNARKDRAETLAAQAMPGLTTLLCA